MKQNSCSVIHFFATLHGYITNQFAAKSNKYPHSRIFHKDNILIFPNDIISSHIKENISKELDDVFVMMYNDSTLLKSPTQVCLSDKCKKRKLCVGGEDQAESQSTLQGSSSTNPCHHRSCWLWPPGHSLVLSISISCACQVKISNLFKVNFNNVPHKLLREHNTDL